MNQVIMYLKNEIAKDNKAITSKLEEYIDSDCNSLDLFKIIFQMIPEEEKQIVLQKVIHETDIFQEYDIFNLEELFKPYIIAKNVSVEDLIKLKKLQINNKNILKAMMFSICGENYLYSCEYFCDGIEFFNWNQEYKFRKIIEKWY